MKLIPETGNLLPRTPTPLTDEAAIALTRRNRSTFLKALIQPPFSYSKSCREPTASSANRATASTSWKGGDDIDPLSGGAIGHTPIPLRGLLRGEIVSAAHPGLAPPRGETSA